MTRIGNTISSPATGTELPTQPAVTGDGPPAPALTRSTADPAAQPALIETILTLMSLGLGLPQAQDAAFDLEQLRVALDALETDNRKRRAAIDGEVRSLSLDELGALLSRGSALRQRQDELKAQIADKLRELAGLEAELEGAEGDDLARLNQLIDKVAGVIADLKAEFESNDELLAATSTSAAGFLLDLLQSALADDDLDTARSQMFDTLSEIGFETILEVLKRFGLPDDDSFVEDAETRKLLEKLLGALALVEETVQALRDLAALPPPQSVQDEALRNGRRLQLSLG